MKCTTLTTSQIKWAAKMHKNGMNMRDIAAEIGCSKSILYMRMKELGLDYKNRSVQRKVRNPIEQCSDHYRVGYNRGFKEGYEAARKELMEA